jgi:hypothetical protein
VGQAGSTDPYYQSLLDKRIDPKWERFSWLTLRALLSAANDKVAGAARALVDDRRQRWVAAQRAAGALDEFPDLVVDLTKQSVRSFLVLGDPGEADDSQYAVVKPLLAEGSDTAFMLIASDVIYPAGDVNDYVNGFYIPYAGYEKPIYAIPGNHDWYDGLEGFMFHFCGADALPRIDIDPTSFGARERLWRRAWRRAASPQRAFLHGYRSCREPWKSDPWARHQPGSYFALDLGRLLVVCIDTGVTGELDAEQGDWLRRTSARADRAKLLVTGKPLYVDNERKPGPIDDYFESRSRASKERHRFVDEIVRDPVHGYIGAIGGDIHNYQHYKVPDADGQKLTYLVSGGGGAYLGSTHKVRLDGSPLSGVSLPAVRTYPSAAESLRAYARTLVPVVWSSVLALGAVLAGVVAAAALVYCESRGWLSFAAAIQVPALAGLLMIGAVWLALELKRPERGSLRGSLLFKILLVAPFAAGAEIVFLGRIATDGHVWQVFESRAGVLAAVGAGLVVSLFGAGLFARELGDREPFTKLVPWLWFLCAVLAATAAGELLWYEAGGAWVAKVAAGAATIALPIAAMLVDQRLGKWGYPGKDELEVAPIRGLPDRPKPMMPNPKRKLAAFFRRRRGPLLFVWAVVFAAAVSCTWIRWDEQVAIAELVTAAMLLLIPATLMYVYELRRWSSDNAIFWILLTYAVAVVLLGWCLVVLDAVWIAKYLAGFACAVATVLVLVLLAYLFWIRGFSLLWRRDARSGVLDEDGSEAFLAWFHGKPAPPPMTKRVRLLGRIVMPSHGKLRSPVHRLLAEVFEPSRPHLYKSFLRIDLAEDEVTITCFGVTGGAPAAQVVDTISLPLGRSVE